MKKNKIEHTPSSVPVNGRPETSFELINKYGTYNIQPTCDCENEFPMISQGLPDLKYDERIHGDDVKHDNFGKSAPVTKKRK